MTHPPPLQQTVRRLPIGQTVAAAYCAVFGHLPAFARAALVPYLISLALWVLVLLAAGTPVVPRLLILLEVVPATLFAVAWHRRVLLGPGAGAPAFRPSWEARHWLFLAYSLGVTVIVYVVILLIPPAVALIFGFLHAGQGAAMALSGLVTFLVLFLLVFYFWIRFAFVFAAVAVDENYGLHHAWRHSKGHAPRLMAALVLAALPLMLLSMLVGAVGAGLMGRTLWTGGLWAVQAALYYLMLGLTVSVISIAFRTCAGWVPRQPGPSPESNVEDGDPVRSEGFVPGGGSGGGKGFKLILGTGFTLVLAVVAVMWLASGFYRVQPDQQGVVLRFGEWVKTTPPGRNWHWPYPIETVLTPRVERVHAIDIGFRFLDAKRSRGQRRDVPEESLMVTGDQNIIDIDFTVQWKIADAGKFLFNNRNPEGTVKDAAESAMREVIGRSNLRSALTVGRRNIERKTRALLQKILDDYEVGIEIIRIQLQDVKPPGPVIAAYDDCQRARQDRERLRNEAEKGRSPGTARPAAQ